MQDVFVSADNIISSLGFTTNENVENIKQGISGIRLYNYNQLSHEPLYVSLVDTNKLDENSAKYSTSDSYTKLERMIICSISDAIKQTNIDIKDKNTLIILSTTKGNIDLLDGDDKFQKNRLFLWKLGNVIGSYFQNPNQVRIVSNACISGVLAIITAAGLIRNGIYENVIVTGADIISRFVVAGFQSFKSLSTVPCKPFDVERDGLSLGEGCGTIILTSNKKNIYKNNKIKVLGGGTSNDANHLSAPSRTAEGLYLAINKALENNTKDIDYISAHGTATLYNDEMEAKAINRCGFEDVPVNSFKGYFGHTLGAAGIIESIVAIKSMEENILYTTAGYNNIGVPDKINVINKTEKKEINKCLKLASGFGGCNAAIVFEKL